MEEVQQSVVHSPQSDAQFVDTVPKVISLGSAKLVAELAKPFNAHQAFGDNLARESIKPRENRYFAIVLAIENDFGSRQNPDPLIIRNFALFVKAQGQSGPIGRSPYCRWAMAKISTRRLACRAVAEALLATGRSWPHPPAQTTGGTPRERR